MTKFNELLETLEERLENPEIDNREITKLINKLIVEFEDIATLPLTEEQSNFLNILLSNQDGGDPRFYYYAKGVKAYEKRLLQKEIIKPVIQEKETLPDLIKIPVPNDPNEVIKEVGTKKPGPTNNESDWL